MPGSTVPSAVMRPDTRIVFDTGSTAAPSRAIVPCTVPPVSSSRKLNGVPGFSQVNHFDGTISSTSSAPAPWILSSGWPGAATSCGCAMRSTTVPENGA